MNKILAIANREYRAMVGTKAFLISIVMMPILMFASLIAVELLKDVGQTKTRKLAIIDHSGEFGEAIEAAAEQLNRSLEAAEENNATKEAPDLPGAVSEKYEIENVDAVDIDDELRFELSERIRNRDLYAFVEIPAEILNSDTSESNSVKFFAEDSSISNARRWVGGVISSVSKQYRLVEAGIGAEELAKFESVNQPVPIVGQGLMRRSSDGTFAADEERNVMLTLFLPMGIMMFMFMVIFMASQPMLESVLEEKSQRIAEVLLGSANPTQLMLGKLLGTVGGSLTIFLIYLAGVCTIAASRDWTENIPLDLVPWFLVFQVVGVLFYAAIFMSVGASVSQLKEAQSLLLPVWMVLMAPMFVWFIIVRDPHGPLAMALSFIPPTAPTTMVLRMATGQSIALWQPLVSLSITIIATLLIVVIAGRIFRVGILWQGKTPKFSEIMKWAITGE